MASWLKAAEDILEGVDRRVKLVAGEKSDEQPVVNTENNRQRSRSEAKKSKPRAKPWKELSSNEASAVEDTKRAQSVVDSSEPPADNDRNKHLSQNGVKENSVSNIRGIKQHKNQTDGSIVEDFSPEATSNNETVPAVDHGAITFNAEESNQNSSGAMHLEEKQDRVNDNVLIGDNVDDANHGLILEDANSTQTNKILESRTQYEDELPSTAPSKIPMSTSDTSGLNKQTQEEKSVSSDVKVQEQLDEAQGLLKSAISTGQSKEARLARVCAGLSSRLQEYKSENTQLEELLVAEKELTRSYEAHIKQLKKELSASKEEATRVEANMLEALSAKNAEIDSLASSVGSLKKQAALAEGNFSSVQETMESVLRNRELAETRMIQALREELAAAERRADEERSAHNAIKLATREREVELEHRALEASAALAKIQRVADDKVSRVAELEQKIALLEVECASLNQELQDMEASSRLSQKKSSDDSNQAIQVQAWQEEVERARQSQRETESKLSLMEVEFQKMRVQIASMTRDAEHYSRQEHMELEKRYSELTDLLYYKQTQLETMASEKAAAEFQLEKEVRRLQEAQMEAERNRASRRASSSWEEESDIKTLEPLPLHHRQLAGVGLQLQQAAKFLDKGALRATRFFYGYPTARVILLCYLVFVHLFLMYLMHHLQEQADSYTPNEVAESMGLLDKKIP